VATDETMADMKTSGANRCLLIATMSLVTATLPLIGLAQEEAQAPVPQRRYVSDKLVLNVYAQSDQSGGRVATIQTGDSVDELERVDNMVHVRLEDGREGWVGANYLTSDAPAAVRLRELQRDQKAPAAAPAEPDKKSIEEIARLKKENAALQGQVNALQSRVTALGSMAEGAPAETPSEPEVMSEEPAEQPVVVRTVDPAWWIWSIAIVLTGALGYASGYQTLARRLRRKFGGLKIY
jgi:SH3 domain protein